MSDDKSKAFMIDSTQTGVEMPTLTSLLYKKKAVKSDSSEGKKASAPVNPILSLEPSEISVIPPSGDGKSAAQIVQSAFSPSRPAEALNLAGPGGISNKNIRRASWVPEATQPIQLIDPNTLGESPSPIFQGVRIIQERSRLRGALVFEVDRTTENTFRSIACIGLAERVSLFSGMLFDSTQFSDLWGRLSRYGFIEFSPVGVAAQGNFDRGAFRVAFGVDGPEWMTLVRLGSPENIYGVVAFFTEGSIQSHLPQFHSLTSGESGQKAA